MEETLITVHCKKGDYNLGLIIYTQVEDKSSLPYAIIEKRDEGYKARLYLTNVACPKAIEELKLLHNVEREVPVNIGEKIIQWLGEKPIRSYSQNDKTNWDALKTSYLDTLEVIR